MDLEINIGRRWDDGKIIVNFGEKRQIVWADTQFVKGVPLEAIPSSDGGNSYAMILVNERWNGKLYFARKRESWTKDDYFDFAERRFRELGISHLTVL